MAPIANGKYRFNCVVFVDKIAFWLIIKINQYIKQR